MKIETYIVDSFTDAAFKGNPAGVCILQSALTEGQTQTIAMELGLSETAFIVPQGNNFAIRYFSPKMEIPLCGHATLASAKILFHKDPNCSQIVFRTIENLELTVHTDTTLIEMEFPVYNTVPQDTPSTLLAALGIPAIKNSEYNAETNILLLEIEDAILLRNLNPDFEQLKSSHNTINGVLVTAPSKEDQFDFESRYFWPWSGTNEDPVTGGTHTFLAKYWSTRLGKNKMQSFQCSERSGFMEVELIGEEKMKIRSQAQIILKGELYI